MFQKFQKSAIAVLYSYLFYVMPYKAIDRGLKTAPVAAIPVNPYFLSKSAEHDVTLTSLTADIL